MTNTANDNGLNDKAYFCPTCGTAAVNHSVLSGGLASCTRCDWKGRVEELAAVPFGHDFTSPDAILHALFIDIRQLMSASFAIPVGKLLLKWGFMTSIDANQLRRYLGAISNGIAKALIEERRKMELEGEKKG